MRVPATTERDPWYLKLYCATGNSLHIFPWVPIPSPSHAITHPSVKLHISGYNMLYWPQILFASKRFPTFFKCLLWASLWGQTGLVFIFRPPSLPLKEFRKDIGYRVASLSMWWFINASRLLCCCCSVALRWMGMVTGLDRSQWSEVKAV